jgi:hypothetical protein
VQAEEILWSGSKDLMQRNGGEYVMIEVLPAGYIDGVCLDNTFGIKRC